MDYLQVFLSKHNPYECLKRVQKSCDTKDTCGWFWEQGGDSFK